MNFHAYQPPTHYERMLRTRVCFSFNDEKPERVTYVRSMRRLTSDWDDFPFHLDEKGDDLFRVFYFALYSTIHAEHSTAQHKQDYFAYIGCAVNCYMWWVLKRMSNIVEGEMLYALFRTLVLSLIQCAIVRANTKFSYKYLNAARGAWSMRVTVLKVGEFFECILLFSVNDIECKR